MRRLPPRFLLNIILLCMPLLAAMSAAVYFYIHDLPRLEMSEKSRLRADYREIAEGLKAVKDLDSVAKKTRGWSSNSLFSGSMAPGEWGCLPLSDAEMTVWYREGRKYFARNVPMLEETDIRSVCFIVGVSILGFLLVFTLIGVRFFVIETYARDDFLAATAHDLTTPLTALRLFVGAENKEAQQAIERLMRLVGNIKDYLRPGGHHPKLTLTKVDLLSLYKEAYKPFSLDFQELWGDGKEVPLRVEGDTPWFVRADETRLLQIIWNLLSNELKYAAAEGAVEIRLARVKDKVVLSFVDEGPGMSYYARKHAFSRYFRARNVKASSKNGFGIGLCTSYEMARLMGGSLTVSPNIPHGCIFTLTLPVVE